MSGHAAAGALLSDPRNRLAADAWERFVRGEDVRGGVRADVLLSWHRCRDDYGIDPARECAPVASDTSAPADTAVVAAELGAAAVELAPDVEAVGAIVSVADGMGRVLSAWGDRRTLAKAREQNLGPLFGWSESNTGTTGIGLALESARAVNVLGSEHWCSPFQDWSCSAVGVRDPVLRAPVGVIAVSAWRRPLGAETLAPLLQAATRVERRLHERLPKGERRQQQPVHRSGGRTRVAATHAGRTVILFADEILLAEFDEGIVWLQTAQQRFRALARNLVELEQRVAGVPFVRISRQVLVNADHVREVTRSRERGVWIALDGAEVLLPVSRRRTSELRRALRLS